MFIQKIQNFLLSNVNIAHTSSDDVFCGFAESKMVFMVKKAPTGASEVKSTQNKKPDGAMSEKIKEFRGRLKLIINKSSVDSDKFKWIKGKINALEAKLQIAQKNVKEKTVKEIDTELNKYDAEINAGSNANRKKKDFNSKTTYTKQKKVADKVRKDAAAGNSTPKPKETPTNQPKTSNKPKNKLKLTKKQLAKLAKAKEKAEELRKAAEKLRIAKEKKFQKARTDAVGALSDLSNGMFMTDEAYNAVKTVAGSIQKGQTHNLPDVYLTMPVLNKDVSKGTESQGGVKWVKSGVKLKVSISRSKTGDYYRVVLNATRLNPKTKKHESVSVQELGGVAKKELYLNRNLQLRSSRQIKNVQFAKLGTKEKAYEKVKQPKTAKNELAQILNVVESEGYYGFEGNRGRIRQLLDKLCPKVNSNKTQYVNLPGGYRVAIAAWDAPEGKPERIIFKNTEVIAVQGMHSGELRHAKDLDIGNTEAKETAEHLVGHIVLPTALRSIKARGKAEYKEPYFSSPQDLNNFRFSLLQLARTSKSGLNRWTMNYGKGMNIEYKKTSEGHGIFTIKAKGFILFFDTSHPDEIGLPERNLDGDIVSEAYYPILIEPEKVENKSGEKVKVQDSFKGFLPTFEEEAEANANKPKESIKKNKTTKKTVKKSEKPKNKVDQQKPDIKRATVILTKTTDARRKISDAVTKHIWKEGSSTENILVDSNAFVDTWGSIHENAVGKPQDVIKNPKRYGKTRGKFILQVKDNLSYKENKVQIHQLLGLHKKSTIFGKGNGVKVKIGKNEGIWYPGDETVYKLKNGKRTKKRLKFGAGNKIEVSIIDAKKVLKATTTTKKPREQVKAQPKKSFMQRASNQVASFVKKTIESQKKKVKELRSSLDRAKKEVSKIQDRIETTVGRTEDSAITYANEQNVLLVKAEKQVEALQNEYNKEKERLDAININDKKT